MSTHRDDFDELDQLILHDPGQRYRQAGRGHRFRCRP